MAKCKPVGTPGFGSELSTKQPEETLLSKEETQRYQAITGSVMYLGHLLRYDIMYSSDQLACAMSRPAKLHMGAAKQLLHYLAGPTDFTIVFKKGSFKVTAFSDSNWVMIPTMACQLRVTSLLSRAPVRFKSGVQSLTAMSTM